MKMRYLLAGLLIATAGTAPALPQPKQGGSAMAANGMKLAAAPNAPASNEQSIATDEETVAALDLAFQQAVKRNDADTIDRILHQNYWLVLGNGKVVTRQELIDEARAKTIEYEIQDEEPGTQKVRIWNDTAVVTAKLHIKGRSKGKEFAHNLWFSDTYVRTPTGWKYAFAQASLPLPTE